MSICKIVVADIVYTGQLKKEFGPASTIDFARSSEQLAELKGTIASEWLRRKYPEAELYADVAIYDGFGQARAIEVYAYDEEDALDEKLSKQLQSEVQKKVTEAVEQGGWTVESAA